jgi:hypothetical protein
VPADPHVVDPLAVPPAGPSVVRGFIVGMSRSGTRWLTQRLDEHPAVSAVGETSFFGRRYVPPSDGHRYTAEDLRLVRQRQLHGGESTETSLLLRGERGAAARAIDALLGSGGRYTPGEVFESIARELLRASGAPQLIEKTPHHVTVMSRLAEAFPHARFVVTSRDPYSFMLSYKHQGDRKGDEARAGFREVYHPMGAAIVWRGYARSIARALAAYPDRTLLVSTDEVAADAGAVLGRVQAHFGLQPVPLAAARSNSSFPAGERPVLAPEDVFWLHAIAGATMRELGIEQRPSEAGALGVSRSVAALPGWSLRTAKKFYRGQGAGAFQYLRRWLR